MLSITGNQCKIPIYPNWQGYILYGLYGAPWAENTIWKLQQSRKVAALSLDFGQNILLFLYRIREQFVQMLLSEDKPQKRNNSTYSRFSSSAPPPPLAWACCLIYPWSSAPLHTSKSTLAHSSTCYYLHSSPLLCSKHTQTKASSGAITLVE